LGATERREDERAKFREQMKQVDARRLVVVDECGANIAPLADLRQGSQAVMQDIRLPKIPVG
jgi:hypothetical protein